MRLFFTNKYTVKNVDSYLKEFSFFQTRLYLAQGKERFKGTKRRTTARGPMATDSCVWGRRNRVRIYVAYNQQNRGTTLLVCHYIAYLSSKTLFMSWYTQLTWARDKKKQAFPLEDLMSYCLLKTPTAVLIKHVHRLDHINYLDAYPQTLYMHLVILVSIRNSYFEKLEIDRFL